METHGEHVGQTGKPVATNLYCIGISGAIQHCRNKLSKVKVVINSDPEALLKLLIMEL
jgi:electron transfer flavoprotein alpha subunit